MTVARVVGGTTDVMRRANLDGLNTLAADPRNVVELLLHEGPRNVAVAQLFTWWGVLVDARGGPPSPSLSSTAAPALGGAAAARAGAVHRHHVLIVPVGGFG